MSAWFERWTGLTLLDPQWLWLLPLLAAALVLRARRRPAVAFAMAATLTAGGRLPATWRTRLAAAPRALAALGVVGLVVALARPCQRTPLVDTSEGIDILLCLDISSSMAADDMAPGRSRLQVARDAAADFLTGRGDDRVGLITFARYADLRCPLTRDHQALARILDDVELVTRDGPEDATGIGLALARAAQVLAASSARSRVVILLTDGEENVADTGRAEDEIPPLHAAQLCARLAVRAYTIVAGVGTRAADGSFRELDTSQVREVARRTGARFFAARDADAVARVYAHIDQLEKIELSEPRYLVEDRFVPFALVGALLLLLARTLAHAGLEVLP